MPSPQRGRNGKYFHNLKLDDIDAHNKILHAVHQLDWAQKSFHSGQFRDCRIACKEIVELDEAVRSKTVRAKAFMLLARPEVEPHWWRRATNAREALKCWDLVIERDASAHSRFPVDQAYEYRNEALRMVTEAQQAGCIETTSPRTLQASSTQTQDGRFRLRVRATPVSRRRSDSVTSVAGSGRAPLQDITNRRFHQGIEEMPQPLFGGSPKVRDFALEKTQQRGAGGEEAD